MNGWAGDVNVNARQGSESESEFMYIFKMEKQLQGYMEEWNGMKLVER